MSEFRIENTIASQYANSPILLKIIQEMHDALDPSKNIAEFYNRVFRISSASGFGLDIWGRIVGVGRNVPLQNPEEDSFGFNTNPDEPQFTPFNVSPFRSDTGGYASYALPDFLYRKLIIAKALSNLILATAPNINKLLKILLDTKAVYLITGVMQAEYQFKGRLTDFDRVIIFNMDLLPRPCGVSIEYREVLLGFKLDGKTLLNGSGQLGEPENA